MTMRGILALIVIALTTCAIARAQEPRDPARTVPQSQLIANCIKGAAHPYDGGLDWERVDGSAAVAACEAAREASPEDADVLAALARAYRKAERYKDSRAIAEVLTSRSDSRGPFLIGVVLEENEAAGASPEAVVDWYRKAAERGYAPAQNMLGARYANGRGVRKDAAEAVRWFRKAAEQGNSDGQNNLGYWYDHGVTVNGAIVIAKDEAEAVRWYLKAAEQGHSPAQYNLGLTYSRGVIVNGVAVIEKDEVEAVRWYRKAAEQGHASAQYKLGQMYEYGVTEDGVTLIEKDEAEAMRWYRAIAEQGYSKELLRKQDVSSWFGRDKAEAVREMRGSDDRRAYAALRYYVGTMYAAGRVVKQDAVEALRLYRGAGEQGYAAAQFILGLTYATGKAVQLDKEEAANWYRKAAEQGHPQAQYFLGNVYRDGVARNGVTAIPKDLAKAERWYREAAAQGDSMGQVALGGMYKSGVSANAIVLIEKDDAEAVRWFRMAAEQGDKDGMEQLMYAHAQGRGATWDLSLAAYWAKRASRMRSALLYGVEDASLQLNLREYLASLTDRERVVAYANMGLEGLSNSTYQGLAQPNVEFFDNALREARGSRQFGYGYSDAALSSLEQLGSVEAPFLRFLESIKGNYWRLPTEWEFERLEIARSRNNEAAGAFLAMWRQDVPFELLSASGRAEQYARAWHLGIRQGNISGALAVILRDGDSDPTSSALASLAAQFLERSREPGTDELMDRLYRQAAAGGEPRAQQWVTAQDRLRSETEKEAVRSRLRRIVAERVETAMRLVAADRVLEGFNVIAGATSLVESLEDIALAQSVIVTFSMIGELSALQGYGSAGGYFALTEASCILGGASRAAARVGSRDLALALAKRAVNKLQDARQLLDGLPDELRECFLKQHEERYRWFAELLTEQGRHAEALQVKLMLEDSKYAEFLRREGVAKDLILRKMPLTRAERELAERLDGGVVSLGRSLSRQEDLEARTVSLSGRERRDLENQQDITQAWRVVIADIQETLRVYRKPECDPLSRSDCYRENPELGDAEILMKDLLASKERSGESSAILFSAVLPERTIFLLVTEKDIHPLTWRITSVELKDKVERLHAAIKLGEDVKALSNEFYRHMIGPFKSELDDVGVKTIALSLDRSLSVLPMAVLHGDGGYLVERFSLPIWTGRVGSGKPVQQPEVAAFGVSMPLRGEKALPAVEEELKAIVREKDEKTGLFPGVRRLNNEFTHTAIEDAIRKGYSIMHFASHFTIGGSDLDSARLLIGEGSGELISVRNLREQLTPKGVRRPDLLVLSACDTSLPIETIEGAPWSQVARSLLDRSKARAAIGTLWRVRDTSTAEFMRRFYNVLRSNPGISRAKALAQVQRTFIRSDSENVVETSQHKSDLSQPVHWAAFMLFGQWE